MEQPLAKLLCEHVLCFWLFLSSLFVLRESQAHQELWQSSNRSCSALPEQKQMENSIYSKFGRDTKKPTGWLCSRCWALFAFPDASGDALRTSAFCYAQDFLGVPGIIFVAGHLPGPICLPWLDDPNSELSGLHWVLSLPTPQNFFYLLMNGQESSWIFRRSCAGPPGCRYQSCWNRNLLGIFPLLSPGLVFPCECWSSHSPGVFGRYQSQIYSMKSVAIRFRNHAWPCQKTPILRQFWSHYCHQLHRSHFLPLAHQYLTAGTLSKNLICCLMSAGFWTDCPASSPPHSSNHPCGGDWARFGN